MSHEHVYLIQRDLPELTAADAKTHAKEIEASLSKEWASWNDHAAFKPILRSKAKNVIDARWLHKWKLVDGKKVIKSRMCVRGFKDLQGDKVATSASTAARWAQRLVCSISAIHGWPISIADVSAAFMQGMAFDELRALTGDEMREVSMNPPKGSWKFLSNFPIMQGCSEATHVL